MINPSLAIRLSFLGTTLLSLALPVKSEPLHTFPDYPVVVGLMVEQGEVHEGVLSPWAIGDNGFLSKVTTTDNRLFLSSSENVLWGFTPTDFFPLSTNEDQDLRRSRWPQDVKITAIQASLHRIANPPLQSRTLLHQLLPMPGDETGLDEKQSRVLVAVVPAPPLVALPEDDLVPSALGQDSSENSPSPLAQTLPESQTQKVLSPEEQELRQYLRIPPRVVIDSRTQTYSPSLSAAIPSAFGANWGDSFVSLSGATAGKGRGGKLDGSMSLGLGLGNSSELAGLTLAYNIGSINNFGKNGTFDLQVSRVAYQDPQHQVAIAAGWSGFAQYGGEGETIIPSTVWGGITSVSLLQPEDPVNKLPLLLSVGVGGGYLSGYDGHTNAYGGVGLQVAPQLGLGLAWSGVGLNLGVSYVPEVTIPLTLSAIAGDLADTSEGGRRLVLSISYGYNFLPTNY